MELEGLIREEGIMPFLQAGSKKQVLQEMSARAAQLSGLKERDIFEKVMEREKLGSTGVGNGIAIPHGKLPGLTGVVGVLARLAKPVPFEAGEDEPVDLVFLLLAPIGSGAEHLKALSRVARLLRSRSTVEALRRSPDAASMLFHIQHPDPVG